MHTFFPQPLPNAAIASDHRLAPNACYPQVMPTRQQGRVLYLSSSALDANVIAWATYDGTGTVDHMSGDSDEPLYRSGVEALADGWRLIQASPLAAHAPGDEFRTGYLKYEFFFEKLIDDE